MGMKRKAENGSMIAKEDKKPNANSEKTNVKKNSMVIKNEGISNSKDSPPHENQSNATDVLLLVRRSGRLISSASRSGGKPAVERINVVENERNEEHKIQIDIPLPFLNERNSKEEVQQIQTICPMPPTILDTNFDCLVQAADEFRLKDKNTNANSETPIFEPKANGINAANYQWDKEISNSKKLPSTKSKSNVTDVAHKRKKSVSHSGGKIVIEYKNNSESEMKEAPQVRLDNPTPSVNERNLEEEVPQIQPICSVPPSTLEQKVDYLVQSVDEFRPKVFETRREDFVDDFSYKSLYIDLQKEVEALREEKNQLLGKLEFANGKIEDVEALREEKNQLLRKLEFANGKIETYEKMKEVFVVPSLGNYVNAPRKEHVSPTATGDQVTSPAPKKKKLPKEKAARR